MRRPPRIKHLIEIVASLRAQDVAPHSATEGIDTSTNGGRFVYTVVASLAEVAKVLGVGRATLYRALKGQQPAITRDATT